MITLAAFLQGIRENVARIKRYESTGDGTGGGCDCIGLIIGAVRLAGGKWTGTHGSNYAARNEMRDFGRITDYYLGEIVYKALEPGESDYDLPEKYKSSGDLRDYYHVGVVTSVNPLNITHCTSVPGGIKVDIQPGAWKWGGQLKMVEYGVEDMEVLYEARVTAVSGRTVNLREKPNTSAKIIRAVPVGSLVNVLDDSVQDWKLIQWNYYTGWMMSKFLLEEEPTDIIEELKQAREAIDRAKKILDELIGGGVF